MFEYDELFSAVTGESFESFLSKDRKLMIQPYLFGEEEWELVCTSNDSDETNKFYSYFPDGNPKGSWEYVLEKAESYEHSENKQKMTNNKYYIPDIKDFHIGYEYELQGYYPEEWEKYIIAREDFLPNIKAQDNDCFITIVLSYHRSDRIRTLYLNEEQIEAEGWEKQTDVTFEKGNYTLGIIRGRSWIPFHIEIKGYGQVRFFGECKSINEFRYVCKLLNI